MLFGQLWQRTEDQHTKKSAVALGGTMPGGALMTIEMPHTHTQAKKAITTFFFLSLQRSSPLNINGHASVATVLDGVVQLAITTKEVSEEMAIHAIPCCLCSQWGGKLHNHSMGLCHCKAVRAGFKPTFSHTSFVATASQTTLCGTVWSS